MLPSIQTIVAVATLTFAVTLARCGTKEDASDSNGAASSTTQAVTTTTGPTTTTVAGVTTTTVPGNDCPATALAAFVENIAPAIDATCSGCHSSNPTRTLTSGQNAANRTSLLAFTGTNAQTLKSKIHGGSHGGGNQISTLPASKIDAWIAAEVVCAE